MIAFLRNLIFHDFWLKLLSLVLAVLTWLIVWKVFLSKEVSPVAAFAHPAVAEQTYVNVPVTLLMPAAEVRDVKVEPSEVQVTVQAEPRLLQDLKPQEIRAQIDLTGIEFTRGLRKRIEVFLPAGVTAIRVVPNEVDIAVPPRQ